MRVIELLSKYFKKEITEDNKHEYILNFQIRNKLGIDGICGTKTYYKLKQLTTFKKLGKKKIASDKIKTGFKNNLLVNQPDYIRSYNYIERVLNTYGVGLSSSGSIRDFRAPITAGRISTSLHYLCRAIDLYVESAMRNPNLDDYVCCYNGDRTYTVYARKKTFDISDVQITLNNVATYDNRTGSGDGCTVRGYFVNLTELFHLNGFQSIRCRKSFIEDPNSNNVLSEWFHFQYMDDFDDNDTVYFGECLFQTYGDKCYSSDLYKANKYKKWYKNEKRFR